MSAISNAGAAGPYRGTGFDQFWKGQICSARKEIVRIERLINRQTDDKKREQLKAQLLGPQARLNLAAKMFCASLDKDEEKAETS